MQVQPFLSTKYLSDHCDGVSNFKENYGFLFMSPISTTYIFNQPLLSTFQTEKERSKLPIGYKFSTLVLGELEVIVLVIPKHNAASFTKNLCARLTSRERIKSH